MKHRFKKRRFLASGRDYYPTPKDYGAELEVERLILQMLAPREITERGEQPKRMAVKGRKGRRANSVISDRYDNLFRSNGPIRPSDRRGRQTDKLGFHNPNSWFRRYDK